MAELHFANFDPATDSVYQIGIEEGTDGVVQEMATAFGHVLTPEPDAVNLSAFVGAVGPEKNLRSNIGSVQQRLGTGEGSWALAGGWVRRSGLLTPVGRSFMRPDLDVAEADIHYIVVTGGKRNLMQRRADAAVELARIHPAASVVLAAGTRPMEASEGPDVVEGMTEAAYMREHIVTLLERKGVESEPVPVESDQGSAVMRGLAAHLGVKALRSGARIAVASNAGSWVQNAGQLRRAARSLVPGFDRHGDQVYAKSLHFPAAETEDEPAETAQNLYSALGMIARGVREFALHKA